MSDENMDAKWVTRKGGGGERFEVYRTRDDYYLIGVRGLVLSVPTDDYELCDPPEVWDKVDIVLGDCLGPTIGQDIYDRSSNRIAWVRFGELGYRVKSIVVEKRRA